MTDEEEDEEAYLDRLLSEFGIQSSRFPRDVPNDAEPPRFDDLDWGE